jgi:hypothetical protein
MNDIQYVNPMRTGGKNNTGVLSIVFPNLGPFTANTLGDNSFDLGIAWANPLDHNALLSRNQGCEFDLGSQYDVFLDLPYDLTGSTNTGGGSSQYHINTQIVDAMGTPLYSVYPGLTIPSNSQRGNGIKGTLIISIFGGVGTEGSLTVTIPSPLRLAGLMFG